MQRREFIKNSALLLGCCSVLSGCKQEQDAIYKKVERRTLNGISFPLISLGGLMSYPVKDAQLDLSTFKKMVAYAMDYGVNCFGTASMHIGKKWENAIGQSLKRYPRSSYILINKIPAFLPKKKEDIKVIFNEQLERCSVDYFDNYLISCINKKTLENYRKCEIYNQLLELKSQGKIKNLGFSGPGNSVLFREIINEHKWDFCQLKLNYLDWEEKDVHELYEVVQKVSMPIIAVEPLRGNTLCKLPGIIAQKFKKEYPNDTQASFALRWVASKNNVFTMLCDMDDFEQMKHNINVFTAYKKFEKRDEDNAHDIVKFIKSKNVVQCTACKYCLEFCPYKINISAIFSLYNTYKLSNRINKDKLFILGYDGLNANARADRCIDCHLCSNNCPQKLNIPELLKEVHKLYIELKEKQL